MRKRLLAWLEHPAATFVLIAALFLTALVVTHVILPDNQLVSSLFAIPVLVAADRLSTRSIIGIGLVAITVYVASAVIKNQPLAVTPFGILGIVVVGYLAVLLAISRMRAVEERERLQTFMGVVAHDLGQPATVIRGSAQLLHRRAFREQRTSDLNNLASIDGAERQMQRLIDDLRDAASVGTGEFAVRPTPTDLIAVVQQVVEEQRAAAPDHRLTVEAPDRLEGMWDPMRLHQLISNLVSNAVKYSETGTEISITVRAAPGVAVVSVTDQGRGMSAAEQERLFHPFTRLPGTSGVKGMGLGLYIAKAIVDAHGGRIGIESEVGRGTSFHVTLPHRAAPAGGDAVGM